MSKKWIIRWNAGHGDTHEVILADTEDEALNIAYEGWKDEVDNNADYDAVPYTKKRAFEADLEEEDDDT